MPGKDRQRALARAKLERQMARRAAQARKRRMAYAAIGAVVAVVVLVAAAWFLIATFWPKPQPDCVYAKDQAPPAAGAKNVGVPPTTDVPKTGVKKVAIATNLGPIEFTMDAAKAPCTVNSIAFLTAKKFYDATPCHRLLAEGVFVLQCGDPTGTGESGPGYNFGTENLPKGKKPTYPKGTVAMAKGQDPISTGSQFFLVYRDSEFPPDYTVFGQITKGLDVLEKVGAGGVGGPRGDSPKTKVQIKTATVTPAP